MRHYSSDLLFKAGVVALGVFTGLVGCGEDAGKAAVDGDDIVDGVAVGVGGVDGTVLVKVERVAVDFSREVRPILSDRCFACHGPDAEARKLNGNDKLALDSFEGATVDLGGYAAVVPGDVEKSVLLRRINAHDAKEIMPPANSSMKPLTDAEKDILKRWIEEGAKYQKHWAYIPAVRGEKVDVKGEHLLKNEIDRFVLARLEREGLTLNEEADKATLIRRVTLTLTGLLPSKADTAAFLADESEGAYEKVVDRLLRSSRHGEHEARYWLDLARYGDTHGLHLDNYREMWPYRDWVVKAINDNKSYKDFVIEQLAGDMLENPTLEQQLATGFVRAHVTTNEGGSIRAEVLDRNVKDRVDTFGTAFLGATAGCASCHDHKYDPLKQKEYYQLYAFFNNTQENPLDGNASTYAPFVRVPSDVKQKAEMGRLKDEYQVSKVKYDEQMKGLVSDYVEPFVGAFTTSWFDDGLHMGKLVRGRFDWVTDTFVKPSHGEVSLRQEAFGVEQVVVEGLKRKYIVGSDDVVLIDVMVDANNPTKGLMLQYQTQQGGWEHRAYWGENVFTWGTDGTKSRKRMGDLPVAGKWVTLRVKLADLGIKAGEAITGFALTQHDGVVYWDHCRVMGDGPRSLEVYSDANEVIWVDDEIPLGGKKTHDGHGWEWVKKKGEGKDLGPVKFGDRAMKRKAKGLQQHYFTDIDQPFVVYEGDRIFGWIYLDKNDKPEGVQLQFRVGSDWSHRVRVGEKTHGANLKGGGNFRAGDLPQAGQWYRIEAGIEDVGLRNGDFINGIAFTQFGGTVYFDKVGVESVVPRDEHYLESRRVWESMVRSKAFKMPAGLQGVMAKASDERSEEEDAQVLDYYLSRVHAKSRDVIREEQVKVDAADAKIKGYEKKLPLSLVAKEMAKPRRAYLLKRGAYDHPDKEMKIERDVPAYLPAMPEGMRKDRLGLARWLFMKDHPLTGRVAVNRFWQQHFGVGLVKTSEDFGLQSEWPSHPKLLDWLSVEFAEGGWDVKALHKLMVMSATFRQSSVAKVESYKEDSENRLLSRGPRYRLDAEVIRDVALDLSGLLIDKLGGKSVKPPQPDGLWYAVGYTDSNTVRFKADTGNDKIYRRSLYTFWKRTSPPPALQIFDAPTRESCTVRRARTNTPLHALTLMNEGQFVIASKSLAARIVREGGAELDDRLAYGFSLVTGRAIKAGELKTLKGLYVEQRTIYLKNLDRAEQLVGAGYDTAGHAAMVLVANTLLNLDEVITIH